MKKEHMKVKNINAKNMKEDNIMSKNNRKELSKYISSIFLVLFIISLSLTGCKTSYNTEKTINESDINTVVDENDTARKESNSEGETNKDTSSSLGGIADISANSKVVVDTEFTETDLEVGYEELEATYIIFNDDTNDTSSEGIIKVNGDGATVEDNILKITDEGVYVVTGKLNNGQILIEANQNAKIQLVLNGVNITCDNNAPIYIKSADKVFITLNEGTINSLTDGTQYIQTDDNTVDGVIFSKADLTINGAGTLNIEGNYKHGILSKDELVITGGIYNITTVKDALNGKDCVKIKDGTFTLKSIQGNGIQSKNDEDETKGYVYIAGGNIDIVNCQEGIEGTAILIIDGTINITAMDDGLNAASGTASSTENEGFGARGFEENDSCYILISGGTMNVDASGDGIDTNGSLYITGGTTYVSGPANSGNGGLDYSRTADITGGTVVITGSTGMVQAFSNTSTQYSLLYNLSSTCNAGSEVKLTDADGNIIVSYVPNKKYQSVVISTPDMVQNEIYILTADDQSAQITLSDIVTSNSTQGINGFGGHGGGMKNPDQRPGMEGFEGKKPDGFDIPDNIEIPEGFENPDGQGIPEGEETPESTQGEEEKEFL